MKVSQINYGVLFNLLKDYYEVEDDECVFEILYQAEDMLEEVVNALKLLQDD